MTSILLIAVKTEKPSVVKDLVDQKITEDDDCSFDITVAGKPVPEVQWCVTMLNVRLLL